MSQDRDRDTRTGPSIAPRAAAAPARASNGALVILLIAGGAGVWMFLVALVFRAFGITLL